MTRELRLLVGIAGLGLAAATVVQGRGEQAGAGAAQEHVAMLKASLAASKAALRNYEWIETTIVLFKGEEKSRKEERCYYGADGGVQKVPIEATAAKAPHGLKGRIAAHKKEELTDYMQQAVGLVKRYVPPDPVRIQAVKDAGGLSLTPMPGPGKQIKLTFAGYLVQGDKLAVDLDVAANKILGSTVSSYIGTPDDSVGLTVTFASLTDGSSYAKDIVLDAPAQHVRVNVQNSGYRKVQQ
jgi:hypothetical protein